MNSNMMLLLLLTMGPKSSGSSSSGVMEAFLYSSNMLPEMMRTLLAVTSAQRHADALAQKDTDAAALAGRQAKQLYDVLVASSTEPVLKKTAVDDPANADLKNLLLKLTEPQRSRIITAT